MPPESRSARFRRRISATYTELSPPDEEFVEEVVFTLDTLDRLRAEFADGTLTEQRQGGPRVLPAVVEARLQTKILADLLRRFPEIDEGTA